MKIYKLTDPISNKIRYVGQTKKELFLRLAGHIHSVYHKRNRILSDFTDWIENLLKVNKIPTIELIEECDDDKANEIEKYYIIKLSKNGEDLLNVVHNNDTLLAKIKSQNKSIKIYEYDMFGIFIREWKSLTEAANNYSIESTNISFAANGKRKSAGGSQWRYYKADKINPCMRWEFNSKVVYEYDYEGNYVNEYKSLSSVPIKSKRGVKTISKCCRGKLKSIYGKRYSYLKVDKLEPIIRKKRIKIVKDIVQSSEKSEIN